MYCHWCKELIPEDHSCENKICIYLSNKLKELGLFQFYLRCYNKLEK